MLPLLLLALPARAARVEVQALPWAELGFAPAAPDSPARGPGDPAVDPAGRTWLYDPVLREVLRLGLGGGGAGVELSFPVPQASDLAGVEGGLVVLDAGARALSLWTAEGDLLDTARLPDLAPGGLRLRVEDGDVLGLDLFGNAHPLARVEAGALQAPQEGLQVRPPEVIWDGRALQTDEGAVAVPGALRASGQLLGDWLVVDAVVGEAPLRVVREAVHLPDGQVLALPVQERLYVPDGDLALAPDGALLVLVPRAEALEILWLRP